MSGTILTAAQRAAPRSAVTDKASLLRRYEAVRGFSHELCRTLEPEDCVIQSMPDVSPTRWHLAHTTWFFETFVLGKFLPGYRPFHPDFVYLFNSYYNTVGAQFPRPQRGLLSRPTVKQVWEYRRFVDERMKGLLEAEEAAAGDELSRIVEIGLHHEQQHQELMLTDIKHVLSCNPLYPVYREAPLKPPGEPAAISWVRFDEGLREIGHEGDGFSFDNERPRHRVFVHAFELADRLITNGEFMAFIEDGGYTRPELWLSEGWATVQEQGWDAPLYWTRGEDGWRVFTLSGLREVDPAEPVCHVSYFEADAYARWAGARLPWESEWEIASERAAMEGNFADDQRFHPRRAGDVGGGALRQMFGDVWEWTGSPYVAYPGYRPPEGALGEYNGKFMCNQMVLRGGSCGTSRSHIRRTYRNFFPPSARWQFGGFRLAR